MLQWFGSGFSIYGGANNTLSSNAAFDTLNFPGLQASTNFIEGQLFPYPPATPLGPMSANISNMNLDRCGGNGFNQGYGALLTATINESINSVNFSNINILNPTYQGIDIRTFADGSTQPPTVNSNVPNTAIFNNINVSQAPVCGGVGKSALGSAQVNNACYCATANSTPAACSLVNSNPNFKVTNSSNAPCEPCLTMIQG